MYRNSLCGVRSFIRNALHRESFTSNVLSKVAGQSYLELDLTLDLSWEESRNYEYSKLYFRVPPTKLFSEDKVICFRVCYSGRRTQLRIQLPDYLRECTAVAFRVDALPYAKGAMTLHGLRLVDASNDDAAAATLTNAAALHAQKETVRHLVERSEQLLLDVTPHYPESLGLELTPNCNLSCGHCSSHGTPELHRAHNKMDAMSREMLGKLAAEVFPHLTVINVVGRGESTMVSKALWDDFVRYVRQHQVFVSMVTNAYDLKKKITAELIPFIDTLTISIDGITESTFAMNRGGASLRHTIEEIAYYHALRRSSELARRPKLCLSWTLKRNNIAEFPEFIRQMAQFEPDLIYARHLFVFHEKDRAESLLDSQSEANHYLAEAYALMKVHGIRSECPPLFETTGSAPTEATPINPGIARQEADAPIPQSNATLPARVADRCVWFHRTGAILAGGQVSTCGRHYAEKAGDLASVPSFMHIWNGPAMRGVRASFGTANEWNQCKNCWFRESRYDVQRAARALHDDYPLTNVSNFSLDAWDFRGFETGTALDPSVIGKPLVFVPKATHSHSEESSA
jgi:MoaA/NifB/PqqE/SkfB family radical SAM enzyme